MDTKLGMFSLTSNRIFFFSFIQLGLIIDRVHKPTANVLLLKSIYWCEDSQCEDFLKGKHRNLMKLGP